MLDYLKARVIRRQGHGGNHVILNKDKKFKAIRHKEHETVYSWFPTIERATQWIEEQRHNPRLGFNVLKCEVFPSDDGGYRACVAGNGTV